MVFSRWSAPIILKTGSAQLPPSVLSDSDSDFEEEEDEADEDSNGGSTESSIGFKPGLMICLAEDNYKNDYPDEEEPSDSSGMTALASF